jgi:hypothetical protein
MGLKEIMDGNSAVLTARFMKGDEEDIPSEISYRIDCLTNKQEVRGNTPITPGGEVEIPLTSSDNTLIVSTNRVEVRVVTLTADYGEDDNVVRKIHYLVKALGCPAYWLPHGVYVGWADDIGFGHEDDYTRIIGE